MPDEKTPEQLLEEQQARGDFVEGEDEAPDADDIAATGDEHDDQPEAEPEADPGAAADAEEEEEDEEEPGAKADDAIMVPKGRLDEALVKARQREQELQRRLDAAEARKKQETTSSDTEQLLKEIDELDTKYEELLLEGELEKAREIRKQVRQKNNDLFDIRLEQRSTAASRQAVEQMRFDRQLAEYEVKHPQINPDSAEFDQDVANEVAELLGAFEAKGWNPVAALNKAVGYVLKEDATTGGGDPEIIRTKRKVQARKKVADAAKKSPPDLTDKGRDSDKIGTGDGLPNVRKMTPEQFAELSQVQLSRLRGDTLTDEEVAL